MDVLTVDSECDVKHLKRGKVLAVYGTFYVPALLHEAPGMRDRPHWVITASSPYESRHRPFHASAVLPPPLHCPIYTDRPIVVLFRNGNPSPPCATTIRPMYIGQPSFSIVENGSLPYRPSLEVWMALMERLKRTYAGHVHVARMNSFLAATFDGDMSTARKGNAKGHLDFVAVFNATETARHGLPSSGSAATITGTTSAGTASSLVQFDGGREDDDDDVPDEYGYFESDEEDGDEDDDEDDMEGVIDKHTGVFVQKSAGDSDDAASTISNSEGDDDEDDNEDIMETDNDDMDDEDDDG